VAIHPNPCQAGQQTQYSHRKETIMRVALIGTRGIPAQYGGFETCVEEVGQRLVAAGHEVIVFCRYPRSAGKPTQTEHLGMTLVHLPIVRRRSLETLCHTALSVIHPALRGINAAIVFNAANAPLLPILRARRIPFATHVDGLEWKRAKWGPMGKRYYRMAEGLSVRWSDALIADSFGIESYYREEFDAPTVRIAYGAPMTDLSSDRIAELNLVPRGYHLVVARFEPENHVLEIVNGYGESEATRPLVVVGSAPYADDYTARIRASAAKLKDGRSHKEVRLLGGVWDQDQLNQLYANALTYVHGHSVGGTNPSLLRAAGAGCFTLANDVQFNREVLGDLGQYWRSPADVARAVEQAESNPTEVAARGSAIQEAITRYDWNDVAERYENLLLRLAARDFPSKRPSGRRLNGTPSDVDERTGKRR
jgi:glycosyltransferase involved in cell wall biosynthesis